MPAQVNLTVYTALSVIPFIPFPMPIEGVNTLLPVAIADAADVPRSVSIKIIRLPSIGELFNTAVDVVGARMSVGDIVSVPTQPVQFLAGSLKFSYQSPQFFFNSPTVSFNGTTLNSPLVSFDYVLCAANGVSYNVNAFLCLF